ncbi:MAG: NADPH:quinone reductase [Nitrospinota bacterium]
MRAGWYEKYGPAREVIKVGEIEAPQAGPGEVRVRVHASGVNPSDVKARAGSRGPWRWDRVVPHSDGAGVIDQAGPGVDKARAGERVWLFNGQWQRPLGTAAESIVVPDFQAVRLPAGVSFEEGACLGIPAMTAHRALFSDGPLRGKTVLVTGGAGAVGFYAVQLAKWAGARVIATVSGEAKAARAREAGADAVVNYRSEDVTKRVMELTGGAGVEHVVDVDFGENLPVTSQVTKVNAVVAAYASMRVREPALPWYTFMQKGVLIRPVFVYSMPDEAKRAACADINRAIGEGRLKHLIGARFKLADLAAAHEAQESDRVMGNIVVEIG